MPNLSPYFIENKSRPSKVQSKLPVQKNPLADLKSLEKIKKIIFLKRPLMEKIYEAKNHYSVFEMTLLNHTNKQTIINTKRQAEFISVFKKEVADLLGEDVAKSVALQLKDNYHVSTSEHHGPITHQGKLNSTLLSSLVFTELKQSNLKNVIVLACANISFDNNSFPRGIEFNTEINGEVKKQNLVFFPRNARPCPVVYYPAYTQESIDTAHKKLNELVSSKEISSEVAEKIRKILDEVYANPHALKQTLFSDQVAITNFDIWNKIHEDQKDAPNMINIEQEKIVNALILKHHINQDTLIHKILFNSRFQNLIIKHFDKIMSAFDVEARSGTFLFWGLPKGSKYRVQLWKKGNKLTTTDGSFQISLDPKSVSEAIKNREIYPSTLLSFIILSFYYNLKLLGSFSQTTYYPAMKNAFIDLLKEIKLTEDIEYIESIPTNDLTYPRPLIALMEKNKITQKRNPVTGLDLILYKSNNTFSKLLKNSQRINLKEAMERVMPDLYISFVPEQLQSQKLLELTPEKIDTYYGINEKIESAISIEPSQI